MGGGDVVSRDTSPGHCLGGGYDVVHGAGVAAADVAGAPGARLARVQGEGERGGHVGDVHEVAHRGAVAVHDQFRRPALLDGQDSWYEPGRVAVDVPGQGSGTCQPEWGTVE